MRHMNKETMDASIGTILELIGLTSDRQKLAKDLSGGMKRRLSIGIALVGDPKVHFQSTRITHPLISFRF